MPRLSVIVPVYNVEDYLPQCLQSLRDQALGDGSFELEIVCVNDGSPDGSRAILELYAAVDDRVKIVDKANGGLASARNAGIEAATGDFVAFVDADDFVEPWFAERLLDAFSKNAPDVVVFGARVWPASASYGWLDFVLSPRTCYYEGFSAGLLNDPGTRPFAWRVAVRRGLLLETGLHFDEELEFGEDQAFLLELYPRASRVAVISAKPYVYRASRSGSLMEGRFGDLTLRAHDHVRIVEHVLRDWQAMGFLGKWGRDLFFWSVGFCAPDVLYLENPGRTTVQVYLACTYRAFFSGQDLSRWCRERGELAAFARAVLERPEQTSGFGRKVLFYRHTLAHEGIAPFVRRPLARLKQNPVTKAGSDALYRYAPLVSARAIAEHEALIDDAKDAERQLRALDTLNRDLAAAGRPPFMEIVEDGAGDGAESEDEAEAAETAIADAASMAEDVAADAAADGSRDAGDVL